MKRRNFLGKAIAAAAAVAVGMKVTTDAVDAAVNIPEPVNLINGPFDIQHSLGSKNITINSVIHDLSGNRTFDLDSGEIVGQIAWDKTGYYQRIRPELKEWSEWEKIDVTVKVS